MNPVESSFRRLDKDVHIMLDDVDDMLEALKSESVGRTEAVLRRARIRIAQTKAAAKARTRRAVGEAEVFAHRHPWRTAGMALATGAALGAMIGILGTKSRH
jgi:ElaB/YqjD/DUF883 family membrane-anchored ribosome-binding protein